MPEKLFNSPVQHLLVSMHRFVSSRLDLHDGVFGWLYRHIYFAYKEITDRHLITAAGKLAKPDTLVVDVGANVGFFSVMLARRVGASLLAFEPDRQNFLTLNRLIDGHGLGNRIFPHMVALSDTTGTGSLYLSDLAPTDHKLIDSRSSRSVEIAMARLDDFLVQQADFTKKPISLIKIDVQGAELLVLRGMRQTLKANNYPPILVEYSPDDLTHANVTPGEFFHAFGTLGYHPHALPELKPQHPDWFIHNTRGAYTDLAMIHSVIS